MYHLCEVDDPDVPLACRTIFVRSLDIDWHNLENSFVAMAAPRAACGLTIGESTSTVSPGWQPGLDWYLFRLYDEKIKIRYLTTELADDKLGPVIA